MNLCKDCCWYVEYKLDSRYSTCGLKPSPVDGRYRRFCELERRKDGDCGPLAKFWMPAELAPPKKSWLSDIIGRISA